MKSENDLFERYFPIVQNIVSHVSATSHYIVCAESCHAIGSEALRQAIRVYDPEQAGTFANFVSVRVRSAICDELRRADQQRTTARKLARKAA